MDHSASTKRRLLGTARVRRNRPVTGHRLDRTATVRGTRAHAVRELTAMVASVHAVRAVGVRSRVDELLEAWFAIASTSWAPTTIRQTRSVLDR